jgi:hypothetical protein
VGGIVQAGAPRHDQPLPGDRALPLALPQTGLAESPLPAPHQAPPTLHVAKS